ncbi:MAG: SHOCT domain-containing protein [Clostridia bacterium]|nr:SHOCT domain-containing protein [Clostridia bacterium]
MEEKILAKGTFKKMNIPALVCAALFLFSLVNYTEMAGRRYSASDEVTMMLMFTLVFAALALIFFFWMSGCSITVTDKRVYGTGAFRKRVDLPIDKISSVGSGLLSTVSVATSSGKINFWFVANKDEVFKAITDLLIQRQHPISAPAPAPAEAPSRAAELKEFKEMLDAGLITQEEFDAKKKQVLGL